MIKLLLECFNCIKQFIDSDNKKDFVSKNSTILKKCLVIFMCIILIIVMIVYTINFIKKPTTSIILPNTNSNIIIQLEIPANINGPITLKLSKSN